MDYGKIEMPTKWEDVSLWQFQELMRIYKREDRDILDILELFSGRDKEELRQMPVEFIETMIIHLQFMNCKLEVEPVNSIVIDGCEYSINYMEKLKFGEWTDSETIIKSDEFDYSSLLGILCRMKGEVYDDVFIAEKLDSRVEMFKSLPITRALGLLNFFLHLKKRYIAYSLKSLMVQEGKEQAESLVQSIRSLVKAGVGNIFYTAYVKNKLKRLEQSLKCI